MEEINRIAYNAKSIHPNNFIYCFDDYWFNIQRYKRKKNIK